MKVRRTTITVTGTARHGTRWLVKGKNSRGRTLQFTTTRTDFSRNQRVTLTHHTIKRDGTMTGARFSRLEDVSVPRKKITGKQRRTRHRDFRAIVAEILKEFRVGLQGRAGRIRLEGHVISVVPDKQSWFKTPDGQHHVFGRQVASWLLKNGVEV
ncbi:MAG: hypothetical protein ACYTG5_13445 [Planctomycetota bacterium]|jgi:hypothetical protein